MIPSLLEHDGRARRMALLCILLIAGCQPTMSAPTLPDHDQPQGVDDTYSDSASDWPLRFRAHQFRAACYSTYGCRVHYGRYYPGDDSDDALQISSDEVPNYPENLRASWGPIPNFPPAARVTWRSRDGVAHEALVDIGKIFGDQLIRHNLRKEEVSETGIGPGAIPDIILEVNDRTINVYMRAHISTRNLQEPGNRYSNFRSDLIKVYSRTY